jgi:predicted amidophosphoribosyltransferase
MKEIHFNIKNTETGKVEKHTALVPADAKELAEILSDNDGFCACCGDPLKSEDSFLCWPCKSEMNAD